MTIDELMDVVLKEEGQCFASDVDSCLSYVNADNLFHKIYQMLRQYNIHGEGTLISSGYSTN